jgi:sarcosine dehydrogenase
LSSEPTKHAEVVIIGGGIIGCSIAYHLTKMGVKDVILVEKNGLTHGATWHAAGLVGQLRSSLNTTRMLQLSVNLYDELEKETGQAVDWHKVGSLRLASSRDRLLELKRSYTIAKSFGLDLELISAKEAQDMFPVMTTDGVEAAAFIPSDGYIDPTSVTMALAKGAKNRGAKILLNTNVQKIDSKDKSITSIQTDKGTITCDKLVIAAGMWSHDVGKMAGVSIPAAALEHQFLVTEVIEGMPKDMPTMRDPDNLVYYKPECGALAIGGYENNTLPFGKGGIPGSFGQELLEENFDRFGQLGELAAVRTPVINEVGIRKLINGPIPYSADGDFIMGRCHELDNCYVASGFLYGIAAGGGAGQLMAEWITEGEPSIDIWPLDVRRFQTHQNSIQYMFPRAIELYGHHYTMPYPHKEMKTSRDIRRSPLYHALKDNGAVYGSKAGYERPNWFALNGEKAEDEPCYGKPNWFDAVAEEHRAVRERVALIDQSSFSKIEVRGNGALAALQNIAVSNLDKPIGSAVYTQLCNEKGGVESDLTIIRMGENHFYIVTGSSFGIHDLDWIQKNLPDDGSAFAYDVSSSRAVLNICGPQSRKVLNKVCETKITNEDHKFCQAREYIVGAAKVLAIRIGFVGELGYELHIPTEYAEHVYKLLWEAGKDEGIANVGYRAIDTLRMEKGYLYWSADITPDYNPYEAGLGFKVALKAKDKFIGREALAKVKAEGIKKKLCTFTLDKLAFVYGKEAILKDGKVVGVTTSGNFGHTVGKPILFGYLPVDLAQEQDFEIEVFGEAIKATRHDGALYDKNMEKLKS